MILALLVALLTAPAAALAADGQAGGRPHRWWHSEEVRRELALTPRQVDEIDTIFQDTLPRLRASKASLDELEASLSQLISEARVEEVQISQQIDRVESARSEMSRTRMLMLFRMHRVLSLEQREKLKALHARWDQERRRTTERR
jgi:Spy/CpxP family protein refolding chaperone